MRGGSGVLTEKQKLALDILWNGGQVQEAAHAVGVHRCTIWRWECRKDFQSEWRRRSHYVRKELMRRMRRSRERQKEARRFTLESLEADLHTIGSCVQKNPSAHNRKALDRAYKAWTDALFDSKHLEKWLDGEYL